MRCIVLGAGGHAKPVIEALRAMGAEVIGVLDDAQRGAVLGAPQLGPLSDLSRFAGAAAAVAIGDNATRARLGEACLKAGLTLPPVLHPSAVISPSAAIAPGAQVMARAAIGPEARIGQLALVNTGAIVEHDCVLDDAAHLGPGAVLCGFVTLGVGALVGAGSVVRPGVAIGAAATIASGAAVAGPVPAGERVGGVPARPF